MRFSQRMEPSGCRTLSLTGDATRPPAPAPAADLAAVDAASERRAAATASRGGDADGVADAVRRARADPRAFGEIYDAYFARIYGYVAARVQTRADAEDVVADTFVRALDKLQQFEYRGPGSFAAWLFRIARNRVLDERTRQAHLTTVDPLPDVHGRALPDSAPDTEVEREEESRLLRDLVRSLPPRRQEVIALKFFGGLRNLEIAEVMGVDQRTVASHLCRALEELRSRYERAMKAPRGGS
jgi:RNA polymerase sigma-70 factor (ECF subfamily)